MAQGSKETDRQQRAQLELLRDTLGCIMPAAKAEQLAQGLLEHFGTLAALFRAPSAELLRAVGMEEKTARLLRLVFRMVRAYLEDQAGEMRRVYDLQSRVDALRPKFLGCSHEVVCLMLIDGRNRVLYNDLFNQGSLSEVSVYKRPLLKLCIEYEAQQAIFAHNHPSGNPMPSSSDLLTTSQLLFALESIDMYLADHIIFSGDDFFSFQASGLLRIQEERTMGFYESSAALAQEMGELILNMEPGTGTGKTS